MGIASLILINLDHGLEEALFPGGYIIDQISEMRFGQALVDTVFGSDVNFFGACLKSPRALEGRRASESPEVLAPHNRTCALPFPSH
jgi:hypothetical protein